MTIVILGSRYFLMSGKEHTEITKAKALELYEQGLISHEEVLEYE
jgi:hypothetical protein